MLKRKPIMSSLNPHAEPYIPVQMQAPQSSDFHSKSQSSNEKEKTTPDLFVNGSEEEIAASVSNGTNVKNEDKEYLMDLIYLTVLFPSVPRKLLLDVYVVKNGNLGATIEMLEKVIGNRRLRGKMAKPLFFLFLFLALVSFSIQNDDFVDPNSKDIPVSAPTLAHAELLSFGFPIGLLPSSVKGYNLNETSGVFSVDLGDLCKVTLPPDNYLASYSKKITGKIVKGRIHELDGIRVRALFQWWSITGIRSNGEDLVFEVGVVTAKYPSKNFNESPDCEGRRSAS